jgi:hypothetical protein
MMGQERKGSRLWRTGTSRRTKGIGLHENGSEIHGVTAGVREGREIKPHEREGGSNLIRILFVLVPLSERETGVELRGDGVASILRSRLMILLHNLREEGGEEDSERRSRSRSRCRSRIRRRRIRIRRRRRRRRRFCRRRRRRRRREAAKGSRGGTDDVAGFPPKPRDVAGFPPESRDVAGFPPETPDVARARSR